MSEESTNSAATVKEATKVVLVTGGFGYVGGRVAQELARQGWTVRLGTRHRAAPPTWLPHAEVAGELDLLSDAACERACAGVQAVVHMAATNEIDSGARPLEAAEVNTTGAIRLLLAAERVRVPRFLYFSTAHVYGAPLQGTLTEETLPRPAHPYAISHKGAEDWVLAARDKRTLEGIVVRFSNGMGSPAHPDVNRWTLVFNDLCRQAVQNRRLTLLSSGVQLRDFVTLADAGAAVAHLLALPRETAGDGLFNLGGKTPLRILDAALRVQERCEAILGFTPPLTRPDPKPGETSLPLDYRIDKLEATGFRLTGDINTEIDATLRLCQQAFETKAS